jgi:hypothetical protein
MSSLTPDLLGSHLGFGHREHLRLAWRELREHDRAVALMTPAARAAWADPDLRPLPAHT